MLPYMRPQNTWQSELIDKPRLYQLALDAITRADSAEQGGECFSLFCRGQWLLTGLQEVICQENLLMDFFRGFQQIANAAEVINVILVTELKASVVASKEVIWSYDKVAFIAIIGNQQELEFIPDMLLMSCYSPTRLLHSHWTMLTAYNRASAHSDACRLHGAGRGVGRQADASLALSGRMF